MAAAAPGPTFDIHSGPIAKWLYEQPRYDERHKKCTHALMTAGRNGNEIPVSGRYYVQDIDVLYRKMVESMMANAGTGRTDIPSLSEQRTLIFPMYVDVDLKCPKDVLDAAAIEEMMKLMMQKVEHMYEESKRTTRQFDCIVLQRNGAALQDPTTQLYKHGIHVHFPKLLVNVQTSLMIRSRLIAAFDMYDWSAELGIAHPDWTEIIDKAVYSNGLRMCGSPKATKCKCKKDKPCFDGCRHMNNNHIIDWRTYELCMAFRDGARSSEYESYLTANKVRLLSATTVRVRDEQTAVNADGFVMPSGMTYDTDLDEGKRKRKRSTYDIPRAHQSKWNSLVPVEDPMKLRALTAILHRHSPHYATTAVGAARYDAAKSEYRTRLVGESPKYCLNKQGPHNSNNVYMIVRPAGNSHSFAAVMKCYCPCTVVRKGGGKSCKQYESPPVHLTAAEERYLYGGKLLNHAATAARMSADEVMQVYQVELRRLANKHKETESNALAHQMTAEAGMDFAGEAGTSSE